MLFACTNTENNTPIGEKQVGEASFITQNGTENVLNNTFFHRYFYTEKDSIVSVILKVNQITNVLSNTEFLPSKITIEPVLPKASWTIKTQAQHVENKNNTLALKYQTDYNHEETYSYYNMLTGKHLLDFTYSCLTARVPSSTFKRYIGFVARSNSKDLLAKYDENVLGILSYTSENEPLQQFVIYQNTIKDSAVFISPNTPTMQFVALGTNDQSYENGQVLYLMDLEKDMQTEKINFAFGLTFYIGDTAEESALLFEVKADKISLKDTRYDKRIFTIEKK